MLVFSLLIEVVLLRSAKCFCIVLMSEACQNSLERWFSPELKQQGSHLQLHSQRHQRPGDYATALVCFLQGLQRGKLPRFSAVANAVWFETVLLTIGLRPQMEIAIFFLQIRIRLISGEQRLMAKCSRVWTSFSQPRAGQRCTERFGVHLKILSHILGLFLPHPEANLVLEKMCHFTTCWALCIGYLTDP